MTEATQTEAIKETFEVLPLNAHEVATAWDMLFGIIWDSGLYRERLQVCTMLLDAMAHKTQCWIMVRRAEDNSKLVWDGVCITEIRVFPYTGEKVFSIVHLNTLNRSFGKEKWIRFNKALTKYARAEKCDKARITTRHPALQEMLMALGYTQAGVFEKEV